MIPIAKPSMGEEEKAAVMAVLESGQLAQGQKVAEFEGLRSVFAEAGRSETQWCALGSVKSQIGHTKAAAGAAGLIKASLALHHKVIPPTIKVKQPLREVSEGNSPFYITTHKRPWLSRNGQPRRAAVSALGFGGSNFHVVLEEYAPKAAMAF